MSQALHHDYPTQHLSNSFADVFADSVTALSTLIGVRFGLRALSRQSHHTLSRWLTSKYFPGTVIESIRKPG